MGTFCRPDSVTNPDRRMPQCTQTVSGKNEIAKYVTRYVRASEAARLATNSDNSRLWDMKRSPWYVRRSKQTTFR